MEEMKREKFSYQNVPWQIWVIVGLLIFEAVLNLMIMTRVPAALLWFLAKVIFVVGLVKGWKVIFFVVLAVSGIHVVVFALGGAYLTAFINLLIIALAISARKYYFKISILNKKQ